MAIGASGRGLAVVALLPALALAGCVTPAAAIRERPVIETAVSPKSADDIERCIELTQPGDRTPVRSQVGDVRELTIMQESAGAVMFFTLQPVAGGTKVTFRRKNGLVNYDDSARACYGGA